MPPPPLSAHMYKIALADSARRLALRQVIYQVTDGDVLSAVRCGCTVVFGVGVCCTHGVVGGFEGVLRSGVGVVNKSVRTYGA